MDNVQEGVAAIFHACALPVSLHIILPSIPQQNLQKNLNDYLVPHWNLDTWMNDLCGPFNGMYV